MRLSYSPHRCQAGKRHCPPGNWRKIYVVATQGTGKSCVQMYETTCLPVTPSAAVRRRARTRKGYATSVRLLRRQRLCSRPRRAVQQYQPCTNLLVFPVCRLRGTVRRVGVSYDGLQSTVVARGILDAPVQELPNAHRKPTRDCHSRCAHRLRNDKRDSLTVSLLGAQRRGNLM